MIVGPPLEANSNLLADWLELDVLCAPSNSTPLASVNQTLEIAEDWEPAELDDENMLGERRLAQVVTAIEERTQAIGSAYPFALDAEGTTLSLKDNVDAGGYAYLFCLIVSSGSPDGLLREGPARPDLARARGLFQVCATLASAGFVGGPACSVGFPRADATGFLEKLKRVYAHYGDGEVHAQLPPGAPAQVKDDEIDVIAWRNARGVRPPMGYFLGQAASGANWRNKSLVGVANTFHTTWFARPPAAVPDVCTIMPFCLPSPADADDADHQSQEAILNRLRRLQAQFGEVLHRHRVAHFLGDALRLIGEGVGPIERVTALTEVVEYVKEYRTQLQGVAATT